MSASNDDIASPTDTWARRVCDAADPQDSAGHRLEDAAYARLFGAKSPPMDPTDSEGRDLEDRAFFLTFGEPPPSANATLDDGRTAAANDDTDRYELLELLGRGGNGEVYLAFDRKLKRKLALKLLHDLRDPEARTRFMREAQAHASVVHDNVVHIYDHGLRDGKPYIAMEYVAGGTLRQWQSRSRRSWREVIRHYLAAGRGLAALHAAGLVHRDFKPQNVLLDAAGGVKLTDFGLTVAPGERGDHVPDGPDPLVAAQLTARSKVLGTALFISPEQLERRPLDARSDQFSFCVALFQALYGGHPYAAPDPATTSHAPTADESPPAIGTTPSGTPTWETLLAGLLLSGKLLRPPKIGIPRRVYRALERGLARDPAARYPSMPALLADLAADPVRTVGPPAILVGFGAALVAVALVPQMIRVCKDVAADFAGAWTDERAEAVARAFRATGSPHADAAAEHVRTTLDAWRARWVAQREDNCTATRDRKAQETEVGRRRDTCLDEARDTVDALAARLLAADAATVEAIPGTLTALLPPLERCEADFQRQQTCLDSADDPGLRARLDDARALETTGKYREAEAAAAALLADLADRPRLAAEAELVRGRALAELARAAAAADAFRRAYRLSEQAGCDVLAFEAATRSTKLVALTLSLPADTGLVWSTVAASRLAKLPSSPRLEADYHSDLGLLYLHHEDLRAPDRLARARSELETALALRQGLTTGEKDLALAISYLNLGALEQSERAFDRALDSATKARDHYQAAYGGDGHPALWKPHRILGNVHYDLENPAQARAELERGIALASESHGEVGIMQFALARTYDGKDAERALELARSAYAIFQRELPDEDPQHADLHVLLGYLYSDRNRPAEALPHRQEALRRRSDAPAVDRAQSHIELGITLYELERFDEALSHAYYGEALLAEMKDPPADILTAKDELKAALLKTLKR